jgi:hypothetical protein
MPARFKYGALQIRVKTIAVMQKILFPAIVLNWKQII